MKRSLLPVYLAICACMMNNCKQPQTQKHNILLICVDDLRPELNCYGADYIHSPNIDKLAKSGVLFKNHFVNAPSCGPSRYTLLTGTYGGPSNKALFSRANKLAEGDENINPSMPEWFKDHGYTTVSVGKVSHHPGGRGGDNWNDSTIIEMPGAWDKHLIPVGMWEHPRGVMHGLAHGEIRSVPSQMNVLQSIEGEDTIYPDGAITEEALTQLQDLSSAGEPPFFLAVGLIRPHLPFGAPKSYYDIYENVVIPPIEHPNKPEGKTTWHGSGEFKQYNRWGKDPNTDPGFADKLRRHYAACVSYADAQVGKILSELKRTGADKNTIVVLWGDHGWHLGEHAIWGKHSLFEESLHSPLIIHYPGMQNSNTKTKALVATLDIFPTLCDLAKIESPKFTEGESLNAILDNSESAAGHPVIAYTRSAETIRTKTHRLILHQDGFEELYDLTTAASETKNVADSDPELVQALKKDLNTKLQRRDAK